MEDDKSDISDTDQERQQGRKRGPVKKKFGLSINNYNKKQILESMNKNGWNEVAFDEVTKGFKSKKEVVAEYFNQTIGSAEEHVHEECEGSGFNNLSEWIKFFEDLKLDKMCRFEAAHLLPDLVRPENPPPPSKLKGINLKLCYDFLQNALFGKPQRELDPVTAAFLQREFQSLSKYGNSNIVDAQTNEMVKSLLSIEKIDLKSKNISIDPLNIDKNLHHVPLKISELLALEKSKKTE